MQGTKGFSWLYALISTGFSEEQLVMRETPCVIEILLTL